MSSAALHSLIDSWRSNISDTSRQTSPDCVSDTDLIWSLESEISKMTFTTFQPNCTLPSAPVDYVSGALFRSTLDIVWACLSTIIACTYTVLHLDVIADDSVTSRESRWWPDTRSALRDLAIELTVAGVAILAPEYILLLALQSFLSGSITPRSFDQDFDLPADWTKTHMRYVYMGGFRLCRSMFEDVGKQEGQRITYDETTLDAKGLFLGMKVGAIAEKAPISEFEIRDCSKANPFAKALAMWQISWFGVNLVLRLARRVPVTKLEIGTAAFLVISLPIWVLSFSKPKGVRCGTRIYLEPSAQRICDNPKVYSNTEDDTGRGDLVNLADQEVHRDKAERDQFNVHLNALKKFQNLRIKSFRHEVQAQLTSPNVRDDPSVWVPLMVTAVMALPFAAVHLAVWNAAFPTNVDRWIWRTASLVMISPIPIYIVLVLIMAISEKYSDWVNLYEDRVLNGASALAVSLYVIARLLLMVEMIRCLSNLSPETFIGTWTTNLPHLG